MYKVTAIHRDFAGKIVKLMDVDSGQKAKESMVKTISEYEGVPSQYTIKAHKCDSELKHYRSRVKDFLGRLEEKAYFDCAVKDGFRRGVLAESIAVELLKDYKNECS